MTQNSQSTLTKSDGPMPLILWLLFLMGGISALTILVCFYWLTARLDQVAADGSVSLTDVVLTETVEDLSFTVSDFARWSLAYEIVQEQRDDEVYDVLGTSATDSDLFDQLIILSAKGEVLYDYQTEDAGYAEGAETLPFLEGVIEQLPAVATSEADSLAGYVQLADGYAAVAIRHITPDYVEDVDQAKIPIMVGLRHLNEEWISGLARHSLQTGHQLGAAPENTEAVSLPLVGAGEAAVGAISWNAPRVGTQLRQEVLPPIITVCVVIFVISLGAGRFFRTQHKALAGLRILASTDHLTGILNRAGLDQVIGTNDTILKIASGKAALIYVDLNDFKSLNDDFGHKAGDEALQAMARILQNSVRSTDTVARLGGDEFACLTFNDDPHQAAKMVTARIKSLASSPIDLAGVQYEMKASIGVAVASAGLQWDKLLSQADTAMYWAKRNRSLDAAFYADEMHLQRMAS